LFKNLEIAECESYGQRGFEKNLDKVLNQLLDFYNKYYNKATIGKTKEPKTKQT